MRAAEANHIKVVAILQQMGVKTAETITVAEANRLWGQMRRAAFHQKPHWRTIRRLRGLQ